MESCRSSMDVQIEYTPSGNYYTMHGPCELPTLSAADQAQVRKIVRPQHARVRVHYVGYDMRAGRQRCPHCTTGGGRALGPTPLRFVWYGQAQQVVLVIGFRAYRWRCPACKKTYTDYPAGVVPYRRHSVLLLYQMVEDLRRCSIAEVSRRYHIAEKTLSTLLLRGVALTPDWERLRHEPALHLVVDEHGFAGKDLVITVAAARTRPVLAMLRDDRRTSVHTFLSSIPPDLQQRVTCAATDLKDSYRQVILAWQPTVRLSADPFHVVRLASRLLEEERRFQHAEQRLQHREARLPAGPLRAGSERLRTTTRAAQRPLGDLSYPGVLVYLERATASDLSAPDRARAAPVVQGI